MGDLTTARSGFGKHRFYGAVPPATTIAMARGRHQILPFATLALLIGRRRLHVIAAVVMAAAVVVALVTGVDYINRALKLRRTGRNAAGR